MISLIKDHIISKIRGLINIPFEVAQKKLRPLINLEKFNNEEVIFVMSQKDVKSTMGNEVLPVKIETDSVLLKVHENGSSNDQILSFSVDKNYFVKTLLSNVGRPREKLKNQHVLVEFSSPNIAKPFHIGHLRSTIVGNFVANCCKSLYGRVTKLNYLGDWGVQVGYVKAGLEDLNISTEQLSKDPIRLLYKAYVDAYNRNDTVERAKSFFSELEHGTCSQDSKVFWENVRELSMNNLRDTYSDLEIKFDEYCYESDYKIANIKELLKNLESHGVAKRKSPNDLLVLCTESGNEIPLTREDGTTLYLSRDIAAALDRLNRYEDCKHLYYVVDKSQVEHFVNVANAVHSYTGRDVVKHIQFGRVTGVSSRKGTALLLQDILDKAVEKMAAQQQASQNTRTDDAEVTRILAVTLLMVYMLRHSRCRDFVFNWDNAIQGRGDTGIKLQYTHCRLCSLEENCGVQLPSVCQPDLLKEPLLLDVILQIAKCEEIIQNSIENFESSYLITYMFKLCNLLSKCLSQITVKGQPQEMAEQRLLVYNRARITLAECMLLLGVKPLTKM